MLSWCNISRSYKTKLLSSSCCLEKFFCCSCTSVQSFIRFSSVGNFMKILIRRKPWRENSQRNSLEIHEEFSEKSRKKENFSIDRIAVAAKCQWHYSRGEILKVDGEQCDAYHEQELNWKPERRIFPRWEENFQSEKFFISTLFICEVKKCRNVIENGLEIEFWKISFFRFGDFFWGKKSG